MTARTEGWVGVMIPVQDPESQHSVPGWTCVKCHWTHGSSGNPLQHACPEEGEAQWRGRELPEYIRKQLPPVLLPAADVVGGLWPGAPVAGPEGFGSVLYVDGMRARIGYHGDRTGRDRGDAFEETCALELVSLVLPGPLSTGAQGLAARILDTFDFASTPIHAHRSLSMVVQCAIDFGGVPRDIVAAVEVPHDDRLADWHWRHLAPISTYLARRAASEAS